MQKHARKYVPLLRAIRPEPGAAGYPGGDDATACGSVVSRRSCDGIAFARPANLHGMEKLSAWIREQAREVLAAEVSEKTRAQYERNGARLDADRVVGCPVDLGPYEGRRSTYYAYRAALRWHAASRGVQAVRDYDNARKTAGGNSSPERRRLAARALRCLGSCCVSERLAPWLSFGFDDSPRAR